MYYLIDAAAANLDALLVLIAVVVVAGAVHNLFKYTDGQEEE